MKHVCALTLVCSVMLLGGCKSGTAGKVIAVTVSPTGINVMVGTTQQFSAVVADTNNQSVTWSVTGGSANGTISSTGLYKAPATVPAIPQVTVTAVAQKDSTKSATATLTVTATQQQSNVTVTVSPNATAVQSYTTQQFLAQVTGSTNAAVTWQVNGTPGGTRKLGFISSSGVYVAPGDVPTAPASNGGVQGTSVTVTAVSVADTTASGSASVAIIPANQFGQSAPVALGTSGSNINDSSAAGCCVGTLGSLVTRGGTQFILSNNHVLARRDSAPIGEGIVQPGLGDANCDTTQVARVANLSQFANLETESNSPSPANIDAAIAQVVSGEVDPSGAILYLGGSADSTGTPLPAPPHVGSGVAAAVNMNVAKSGRTTGLTCSAVMAVNTNTSVQYTKNCDGTGAKFTVQYDNQVDIAGGDFSAEGDSGSLVVTQSTADPVGLLYGGSDTDTVANPVAPVLSFFASGGNSVTFVGDVAHAVLGCSLPTAPSSAKTVSPVSVKTEALRAATATRDAHGPELLSHPEVQAVGVGASYDSPGEAAIVFFVTKGQAHTGIPSQVDGVRTRIVEGDLFARRGSISAADTAANEQSVAAPQLIYSISQAEYDRANKVHAAHARAIMEQAGVQGVGIGSSADSPGEAALVIFVIRGVPREPIPAVIDGLRTRVRESSRFTTGYRGSETQPACRLPMKSALGGLARSTKR